MNREFPLGLAKGDLTEGCLVLESGAFRGIYQQGVLDALLEEGIHMQCTVGVSVGALNGAAYSAGQIGQAIRVTAQNIHNPRFIGSKAIKENHNPIGFQFMFEQLNDWNQDSMEQFFDPAYRFVVMATNMKTGRPVYFERIRSRKMTRIVQASASMPYMSRPVVIDGIPYLDGGCSIRVPWKWAFRNGFQKVLIVRTRPSHFRYKISKTAMVAAKLRYSGYPQFARSLANVRKRYNKDAERLEQLAKEGRIYMIAPSADRLDHFMQTDKDILTELYWSGYQDVKRQVSEIRNYLGTEEP